VCEGFDVRPSRKRGMELLLKLAGGQPWRCRVCSRRFWHLHAVQTGFFAIALGLLTAAGLWLRHP
jgi:hypothetical protein